MQLVVQTSLTLLATALDEVSTESSSERVLIG